MNRCLSKEMEYTRPVSLYNEYLDYFGFREAPFSIAPNPEYLYMSDRHREALAHLLYGVNTDGGFVLISGEVGTGKTTLCRHLIDELPDTINVAFVLNPRVSAAELLETICDELGVTYPENPSIKQLVDPLNHFLLEANEAGRKTVVIIDEAQNMDRDVLEQLRLLTNLETHQRKLLQVVLLGQPELLELLSQPSLRQLLQRVTARYHLDGLSSDELPEYVEHRLRLAGGRGQVFTKASLRQIYRLTGGIPRLVNLICDRALLGTYTQEKLSVDRTTVRRAAAEVLGPPTRPPWLIPAATVLSMVVVSLGAYAWTMTTMDHTSNMPAHDQVSLEAQKAVEPRPAMIGEAVVAGPVVAKPGETEDAIEAPTQPPASLAPSFANPLRAGYGREAEALSTLFSYSGSDVTSGHCPDLQHFDCATLVGTLDHLVRLDRPAVVRVGDNTTSRYLVITGFSDHIRLSDGSRIRPEDLLQHWDGHFTLLWNPPDAYRRALRPGDRHPALDAVRDQLFPGNMSSTVVGIYDTQLEDAVRRFQLIHGLKPDGLIGVQTLILLANKSGTDGPRLTSRADRSQSANVVSTGES